MLRREKGQKRVKEYEVRSMLNRTRYSSDITARKQVKEERICPYCGGKLILTELEEPLEIKSKEYKVTHCFVCENNPRCSCSALAYMKDGKPEFYAMPSDNKLKLLREEGHYFMVQAIGLTGITQADIYALIRGAAGLNNKYTHFRFMNEVQCQQAIKQLIHYLYNGGSPRGKISPFVSRRKETGWADKQNDLKDELAALYGNVETF